MSDHPLEQILAAYKKEENGEEEGDAFVDKLIELIQNTPSVKLYKEFAAALNFDYNKFIANMSNLVKTMLKNPDISSNFTIKIDDKQLTYDAITS